MVTQNPSTSPTEAPQKLSDLHEASKQKSFIDEIAKSHNLSDPEKKSFTEKYQKAIDELLKKYEGKKDVVIAEISDILGKFKESIQHEKNDDDDITEFSPQSPDKDKTDADTEKKLGDKEIDEHIKQLYDKIESKLNTPTTTVPENQGNNHPGNPPASKDLPALFIDPNLPDIPEFKNPKQKTGLVEIIINWLGTSGIGGWIRKFIMGYNDISEMTDTMTAMKNIMSIKKESPVSSIINLSHLSEYDFRDITRKNPRLDFSNMRNVEAAFLGKYAEDPKLSQYHSIYYGIEDMAAKIGEQESPNYDPIGRFSELLSYSKKADFAPDYTQDSVDVPVPADLPEEKTDTDKLEEQKQQIRSAQEADINLEQAKKDLEAAKALPDSAEKGTKVIEAETKLKEAENAVKNVVETSKTKVGEMLKNVEDELKDTQLTIEQKNNQKKTLEAQLAKDPNNTALKNDLSNLTTEIRNLEIKENALAETIKKIKVEQEKFPKDTTKTITAIEAQKAAQEAERLATENKGITQTEQTKEKNEKTDEEIKENLTKIETEINNRTYGAAENEKDKIDNPEVLKEMKDKLSKFGEDHTEEVLQRLGISEKKKQLLKKIEDAEAKIQLIKDIKTKEKDMISRGRNINFENKNGWIEKSWDETLEVDVDQNIVVDETFLTKDHPTITAVGGLDNAVRILFANTTELSIGDGADFIAKDGTKFKIKLDK